MYPHPHHKLPEAHRKHIGKPPEVVPSGHVHSEKYKRSSQELIRVSDLERNTSTASIREDV